MRAYRINYNDGIFLAGVSTRSLNIAALRITKTYQIIARWTRITRAGSGSVWIEKVQQCDAAT